MTTSSRFDRWLAEIARNLQLCCHHAVGNIPRRMLDVPKRERGCCA
ncbi:hypothetical protein [Erythrobacter sp.]